MTSQILTIHRIREGVRGNNIICQLSQGLWLNAQRGDGANTSTYGLPKEIIAVIKMLYKNTKVEVCSTDGDTDYFDIIAGVLQGDTLAPYLFIFCLDYVLRKSIDLMKEKGFKLAKERSRRYLAQTITDVDYIDVIALLANTPVQAETQLHILERVAAGIGFHVNADKVEYMLFNQRGNISSQKDRPLKWLDKVTYQGSNVSSTEKYINTKLANTWTAIDRLSVIWTDKIKRSFFQADALHGR